MQSELNSICYLCGRLLCEPTSRDHVPMLQVYSDEIRRARNPNLLTIRVHQECNSSFQLDEDYFVNSLLPLAHDSPAGGSLLKKVFKKGGQGKNMNLIYKVAREFETRPSGLFLPDGKVVKRVEGKRIRRVAWKIVRGLYFHHRKKYLPEATPTHFRIFTRDDPPPEEVLPLLGSLPSNGNYGGVFDYKFVSSTDFDNFNFWALLLWDRLILIIGFSDPTCGGDYGPSNP